MAPLDAGLPVKLLGFPAWWEQVVFLDYDQRTLTRKELILIAANQDGGAHVDPSLDDAYAALRSNNALGWTVRSGSESRQAGSPLFASIRQIAHEVLKTLVVGYHKEQAHDHAIALFRGIVFKVTDPGDPNAPTAPEISKVHTGKLSGGGVLRGGELIYLEFQADDGTVERLEVPYESVDISIQNLLRLSTGAEQQLRSAGKRADSVIADGAMRAESFRTFVSPDGKEVLL